MPARAIGVAGVARPLRDNALGLRALRDQDVTANGDALARPHDGRLSREDLGRVDEDRVAPFAGDEKLRPLLLERRVVAAHLEVALEPEVDGHLLRPASDRDLGLEEL